MKSVITVRGPVTLTYLRDGSVRIEVKKDRPRMHLRGDEFLKLIQQAASSPALLPVVTDVRCGVL